MMIGRLENMDIADDWRMQESRKAKRERCFWLIALAISIAALVSTYPRLSWADTITVDGRTEKAECQVEYSLPPIETCVSESWVCRVIDGNFRCETKR